MIALTLPQIISLFRLRTLPAGLSPVIMGIALGFYEHHTINSQVAVVTLVTTILLQISTNIANDYYDGIHGIDSSERVGPKRLSYTNQSLLKSIRNLFILTLVLAFILGTYLIYEGGTLILIFGLLSIFFAWAYTGGPYPLSYFGLGEFLSFLFFGLVATFGSYHLQGGRDVGLGLLIGLAPGYISAAILAINNLRDIVTDSRTKKRTIAVRMGLNFARRLPLVLILASALLPLFFLLFFKSWILLLSLTPLLFLKTWKMILLGPIDASLNGALAKTGLYLFIYAITFSFLILL